MNTWNDHVDFHRMGLELMGLPLPPAQLGFGFLPAPTSKVQRCKRPEYPAPDYPYAGRPDGTRAGRPYSIFKRTPLSDAELAYKAESDRILSLYEHLRPLDPPDDCRPGMPLGFRPCPFASCRHHLGVTVNDAGSIRVDHGHLDFERLADTCAIDVAQRGRQTHETIGKLVGINPDWARKTEKDMRRALIRKVRKHAPDGEWGPADASGRQTCIPCRGEGEVNDVDCANCDGDGYRWGRE